MSEDPTGRRGRLSRSGRFLPLVKPATIAPPAADEPEDDDDYAEVSIERGHVEETPVPAVTPVEDEDEDPDPDPDDDEGTPAR